MYVEDGICYIIFVGEIGGFMGLLLGGSVLTVLELLDLIIYNILKKILCCGQRENYSLADGRMGRST